MADELFDGNVAFQMDLSEAVARDILSFPTYINGIYKLDEDIKRYEIKISSLPSNELKKSLLEKLELAKRKLENSIKLDELFSKYMKKQNGKYIVFCASKKHMEEMIQLASNWFSKINPEIDIYSVSHGKKNNYEELENFYHSNNSHLKLLFCIDMLNEGFHVPNIDGIIMLRPTISPILFIQQLGRALGFKNRSIIVFDIVNNIKSIQDIHLFCKKVEKKKYELGQKNELKGSLEPFEILEDVRDVFEVLNDIETSLQSVTSKEYKICLIEEFYWETGRLPNSNEEYKGKKIGIFLKNIKSGFTQITEEQMRRLLKLGYDPEKKQTTKDQKICLIEEFYQEFGILPNYNEEYKGIKIGSFLYNIKRGATQITEEQMRQLLKLGYDPEKRQTTKEQKICLIEEFYQESGRLPKVNEEYKGEKIGNFLNNIKSGRVKITEDQKLRLIQMNFLGFLTEDEICQKIEQFYQIYQREPLPGERVEGDIYSAGDILLSFKIGTIRLKAGTRERLQSTGISLKREGIQITKQYVKK